MANFFSKAFFSQSFFIPDPPLTEKNLSNQVGKVHFITGGYTGIGKELCEILFSKGATVYIAGRNEAKAREALNDIKQRHLSSNGRLEFLLLDLNDLASISPAVELFKAKESRLDVLVNNAGVMFPPFGTQTKQGHDMQFGTNVLGPFLLTELLLPTMVNTAKISPRNSVRVLWASSIAIQALAPGGGIVLLDDNRPRLFKSQETNYGQTKVANILIAIQMQKLFRKDGIISVSFNPGNLATEIQRHSKGVMMGLAKYMLYPAVYGAYTELYSGWSEEIEIDGGVCYVIPWGRDGTDLLRSDIKKCLHNGLKERVWQWCEDETEPFL